MRLIDADALNELLAEEKYTNEEMDCVISIKDEDWMRGSNSGIRAAIGLVDRAPTIEPLKHGHWIETHPEWKWEYRHHKCSVCGMCKKSETKYCPECGAKMDEEVSE